MSASDCLPGPIEGVPDDILRFIFLIHVESHGNGCWTSYDWMNLAQVCKRWNSVLLSNPAFFTSISMPAGLGSTTRLSRLLELSRAAPLEVYFSEDHFIRGAALLAQHTNRVKDLHFRVRGDPVRHQLALANILHHAGLASLQSLHLDLCQKGLEHQVITPDFANPIARLRNLRWDGALDWSSPVLKSDLCKLQVEHCGHPGHSPSLTAVEAALRGMHSLELLAIAYAAGFDRVDSNEDAGVNGFTLPRLRRLSLRLPAHDLAVLSGRIAAPVLETMSFIVNVDAQPEAMSILHHENLAAAVRSMTVHLVQAAELASVIHLKLVGPFYPAHDLFCLTSYLDTTMDSFEDRLFFGRKSQRSTEIFVGYSSAYQAENMLDVRALAAIWKRLTLLDLVVDFVSISAATWSEALCCQHYLTTLEIDSLSCVSLLEALQGDQSFLPALAHILLRGGTLARRGHAWMTADLQTDLRKTFGLRSHGHRGLSTLWLEDCLECPISLSQRDSLRGCADVVQLRSARHI
jgi:hypothetical protein